MGMTLPLLPNTFPKRTAKKRVPFLGRSNRARSAKRFQACRWLVWYYRNKANLGSDWGRSHESILHLRKAKKTKLNVEEMK